jgi:YbbR domain-containing protein
MEGEGKVNELLKKDITIRILSLLFAVLLWFYVIDNANPVSSKTVSVQVSVLHQDDNTLLDKGLVLKNKNFPHTVNVTVTGRDEALKNVSSDDFIASIDLADIKSAQDKEIIIDTPRYNGKEDITIDYKPVSFALDMEKIDKNPYRVDVVTNGDLKANFKIIKTTVTPDTLALQGVDSLIKSVGSIKTFVDITNLDKDLITKKECKVFNKNGEEIAELEKNLTVDIKIEVAKEVPITPVVKGNPAKNFLETGFKAKPLTVLITGAPEVLSKVNDLKTETVDIENASANMDISRVLKLPDNIKLYNSPDEVTVSVFIDQLTERQITISKEDITFTNQEFDNSLKYQIQVPQVVITLRGIKAILDKLDIASIKPNVDVGGYADGLQKIPLKVTLPDNVKLSQECTVDVQIDKK